MYETFFEIVKLICPAAITGLITFLITKYNYHKNRPLDKFEIAYNRVYYPLYRLIKDKNISKVLVIEKCNYYLLKYNKYINKSTLIAFNALKKENSKTALMNFEKNISSQNSYLRRQLGYLEPNIFNIYGYSSSSDKRALRIVIYILGFYIPAIITSSFQTNNIKWLSDLLISFFIIFFVLFIIEGAFIIFKFIWNFIIKIFKKDK